MKILRNYTILYDSECPLCCWYTGLFLKTGMLDNKGRVPYQYTIENVCPYIDKERAVNEIALVDKTTGDVYYGIDSLFTVIGSAYPLLNRLFQFAPFIWIMKKVYAFISYNRKVIMPAKSITGLKPTFRADYRVLYLLISALITGLVLSKYSLLLSGLMPAGEALREYLVCFGQLAYQGIVVNTLDKKNAWDYLGNMMTVSIAGAIALLPLLLVSVWFAVPQIVSMSYFMLVVLLMFIEHIRRAKLLKVTWLMTATWVLYRIGVLMMILITA